MCRTHFWFFSFFFFFYVFHFLCCHSFGLINKKLCSWQESTIPKNCLIYHVALTQLHSGHAQTAFQLFLVILRLYPKQPRIWLRIAECCIQALTKVCLFILHISSNFRAHSNSKTLYCIHFLIVDKSFDYLVNFVFPNL
ncbi:unnamed protein product [Gongylonema pulchrum]|uniref:CCR4-NOT transcription complex subunit 10 n=1 Tax=Gongylonema pulchrum TaxID=637853 RepID=A0A3P7LXJ6_9BILA|nr:unnamed protein product [Gongylonema pulchrum]